MSQLVRRAGRSLYKSIDCHFVYLALLPALFFLFVVVGYSTYRTVFLSLQEASLGRLRGDWVGLNNFVEIFSNPEFWGVMRNTLYFTAGTLVVELLVALPVALALAKPFKGISVFRGIVLLPFMVAPVVTATIWKWSLDGDIGVVNYILLKIHLIGSRQAWLISESLAMPSIIAANVWIKVPVVTLILVGGLQSIPRHLYEASEIDGAGALQRFIFITLPLLRNFILLAFILRVPFALRVFDIIWLTTAGGPAGATDVLGTYLYKQAFYNFESGSAAAVSVILLIVSFALTLPYVKALRRR